MNLDPAATQRSNEDTSDGTTQPQPERPVLSFVVDNLEVRVAMHESGTSAVANFIDDRGCEQRVSLVARQGGGALTTSVLKRYEEPLKRLGQMIWPDSQWPYRRAGMYRI
jgi:hypothetical protein